MDKELKPSQDAASPAPAECAETQPTRRSFLKGMGKKSLFMTPAVATLTASPALAAMHNSGLSCVPLLTDCTGGSNCCTYLGQELDCDAAGACGGNCCCVADGDLCAADADCCTAADMCSGGRCM